MHWSGLYRDAPAAPLKSTGARIEAVHDAVRLIGSIEKRLQSWADNNSTGIPRILTDRASRDPYKRFQESKGPLNQIHIRLAGKMISDVAECSPVIAAIETFELFRAYLVDADAKAQVHKIVQDELGKHHG